LPKWRNAFRWSRESIFSFPYQQLRLELRESSYLHIFTDQGHPAYFGAFTWFMRPLFNTSFSSSMVLTILLR
jgi:hypothetical protein